MNHLRTRLLALFIIIVFTGLTYFGWRQLMTEGKYSLKLAAFGPVGIVGGASPTPKTSSTITLPAVVWGLPAFVGKMRRNSCRLG